MFNQARLAICVLCLFWALGTQATFAQTSADPSVQAPLVTAAASTGSVRFTAPAKVYEMRLEVFAADGQMLYDSDFKFGNLLDWGLHNQQGQQLADGSYRCVITLRTLYGQLNRRQGTISFQDGQPTLQAAQSPQSLQPANQLAAGGVANFLALPSQAVALPLTALAHDGQQGRLVSGSGGLSFRLGDLFTGKDVEQMRLTPEGKLGLGVGEPQAKLDVAGLIRTSEGILFPDGSVQTTAYLASGRSIGDRAGIQRDAQGRGIAEQGSKPVRTEEGLRLTPSTPTSTTNVLAKFINTSNGIGDSIITETNDANPKIDVAGTVNATTAFTSNMSIPSDVHADAKPGFWAGNLLNLTGKAQPYGNIAFQANMYWSNSGSYARMNQNTPGWRFELDAGSASDATDAFQIQHINATGATTVSQFMYVSGTGNTCLGNCTGISSGNLPIAKLHVIGSSGYTVYGVTSTGKGVTGVATDSSGWGVYGLASSGTGVAGKFSGDVDITGTLSKAGGSFKIDHPLDPENKFLSHSFVESPDMKNIYDGNVTTDGDGVAVVTLPDYFEALNRDFRYQLTVIGAFAQAVVAEKVKGNQFKIATTQPNVEVSWQVTGVRQDAWANRHRIPNEELKAETEKGYFLHPELYGKDEEKGLDWAHDPLGMRKLKERTRENAKRDASGAEKPIKQ
jgi:hypothetical protein